MIQRLWALLIKETLAQRWPVGVIAFLMLVAGALNWMASQLDDRAPSDTESAGALILLFIPVTALVLGHRLIVREYQAKSQLFLEGLPLRRWEPVLAKLVFGVFVLCGLALTSLFAIALAARETEPRYLLCAGLRATGYAMACSCFCFAMGMLGRLRIPLYFSLIFAGFALNELSSFDLTRFGPIALIDPAAFTYERTQIPWRALGETALLCLACIGLGFGVALFHEGSMAEVLARRASPREVAGALVLLLAEVIGVGWAESKKRPTPFEFTSAAVVRSERVDAAVMYGMPALEPRGRAVLGALERLERFKRDELGTEPGPAVRIAHNGLLDPFEVRDESERSNSGLLLEVNLGSADFDLSLLAQRSLHASLQWASKGRAAFEPNHWFLDGYSMFAGIEQNSGDRARQWLRALVALRRLTVGAAEIERWEELMERAGTAHADAIGFTLVDALNEQVGGLATRKLAREALARPTVTGLLSWLRFRDPTASRRVADLTRKPFAEFVTAWRASGRQRSSDVELAERLGRIPLDRAELRLAPSLTGVDVVYVLTGPSLTRERTCVLRHALARPFDLYYADEDLTSEVIRWPAAEARFEGRLRGKYSPRQRVFVALDCRVPELGSFERLSVARLGGP